jgi:antitoxin PrlF
MKFQPRTFWTGLRSRGQEGRDASGIIVAWVMDFHYHHFMPVILEAEANLTTQNQITIPSSIRRALKLEAGRSRLRFQMTEEGKVEINLAQPKTDEDDALGPFLDLLEGDIKIHPERIRPFPSRLLKKARSLVKGVEVDLDAPLAGED